MKVGFTGTRHGMNDNQLSQFSLLMREYLPSEFHHGDCVGSDDQAGRWIAWHIPHSRIVIHPPTDEKLRAFSPGSIILPAKPYIKRNHDIVDATDILIATPYSKKEVMRGSGTWATIRYAPFVVILNPDGSISQRRKD